MRLAIEGRRAENQGVERRGVVGQCRQGIDEQAQLWEIGKKRLILWVLGRGESMGGTSEEAGNFLEEVMGGMLRQTVWVLVIQGMMRPVVLATVVQMHSREQLKMRSLPSDFTPFITFTMNWCGDDSPLLFRSLRGSLFGNPPVFDEYSDMLYFS